MIGAGKVAEFPPNVLGTGLGRSGGGGGAGGSRVANELVGGFNGAWVLR